MTVVLDFTRIIKPTTRENAEIAGRRAIRPLTSDRG
jgi:hypothetical protein